MGTSCFHLLAALRPITAYARRRFHEERGLIEECLLVFGCINAPLAFFIDDVYLRIAEKKIEKIVKENPDQKLQDFHIARAGGTSFFIPFTVLFVMPICLTLVYVNLFQ